MAPGGVARRPPVVRRGAMDREPAGPASRAVSADLVDPAPAGCRDRSDPDRVRHVVVMAGLMVSRLPDPVVVAGNLSPEQTVQLTRRIRASMISGIVTNGLVLLALVVLIVIGALMRW